MECGLKIDSNGNTDWHDENVRAAEFFQNDPIYIEIYISSALEFKVLEKITH